MDNTVKEPLIHLSKREDMASGKRWLVRIVAIFLSLVVCAGFIFMIIKMNPVEVYEGIVEGAVGTSRRFWVTARDALTLLCVAVAVTPAFKMKFWNIGAEGQILMGCVASAAMMIYAGNALPTGVLLVLMYYLTYRFERLYLQNFDFLLHLCFYLSPYLLALVLICLLFDYIVQCFS